ncbi:hypothetical protein [Rufibacter sp. LB8]|uniref:hypothetical protein n=1 Tax=Rufibacter sp. LB8 TaxID=2777781 RepID=UPI00178C65F5|nr:hypothetical protein [Rufibacter sp. LB8]
MNSKDSSLYKILSFGVVTLILVGLVLLLSNFLKSNFDYQGEAFYKGHGHIIRENPTKGLAFIIGANFAPPILATYLFFQLFEKYVKELAYKILRVLILLITFIVLIYGFVKSAETTDFHLIDNARTVEIVLTWTLRTAGFFIGYQLTKWEWWNILKRKTTPANIA